jgi:hypothetical protein
MASAVAVNNEKYAEWWCENLATRAEEVIKCVKYNLPHNRKLVRVKLYNCITLRMEELYLSDLMNAMLRNIETPFPEKTIDEKKQVELWGPYFLADGIYKFIHRTFHSSVLDGPSPE